MYFYCLKNGKGKSQELDKNTVLNLVAPTPNKKEKSHKFFISHDLLMPQKSFMKARTDHKEVRK